MAHSKKGKMAKRAGRLVPKGAYRQEKPSPSLATSFRQRVLEIVRRIPRGKLLSYGQVATLAGVPRAARIVGGILYQVGPTSRLPWQRVLNARGKISTYRVGLGHEQKRLLEREGMKFNREGGVEMEKYQWWPPASLLKKFQLEEEVAWKISQKLDF